MPSPQSLSSELLARHEANSSSVSPETPQNGPRNGKGPQTHSLPSLPRAQPVHQTSNKTAKAKQVTEVLTINDVDKKLQALTIQQLAKTYPQVKIESSASSIGTTTILLRGPTTETVETVLRELRRKLSPKTTISLVIAAEARPALVGKNGAQVKQLSKDSDTKISLGDAKPASAGDWTMRTVKVDITGSAHGVRDVTARIAEIVDKAPPVKSSRTVDAKVAPFVSRLKLADVKLSVQNSDVALSGPSAAVASAQTKIDELVAESASYVSQRVDVPMQVESAIVMDYGAVFIDGEVFGPEDCVPKAAAALREIARTTVVVKLDIARAHNKSTEHALAVAVYLAATNVPARISGSTGAALSTEGTVYSISGKDQSVVSAAKKQLVEEVNKITPPQVRVLPPLKSVQARKMAAEVAGSAMRKKSVHAVVTPQTTVLVYEVNDEDFAPSQDEISAALDAAAALLAEAQHLDANVYERKVPVASADLRFLKEPLGEGAKLYERLAKHLDVQFSSKDMELSGLREHVDKLSNAVTEIIASSRDYFQRSNYSEQLQFDPKLVKNLIGRSGANIAKLRDEFSVKVDVDQQGQVVVRGLEANVKAACEAIREIEKRLQDETTQTIEIAQKHHAGLIGNKGKFVRRIKEKYDVHVQFPKPGTDAKEDEIVLVGPSKGVQQTIKEFRDLVEYEETHSHTKELSVPQNTVNRIIGRGGANISSIKSSTQTEIEISKTPQDGNVDIKIVGEQKNVAAAAKQIEAIVDEMLDATEKSIEVDPKYHRYIVGPSNEMRRAIIQKAGGVVDPWNPRTLQVPSSTSTSTVVKISGPSKVVASIEQQIKDLIVSLEAKEKFAKSIEIPGDQVSAVLGHGGSRKREIEEQHGVAIDITRQGAVSVRGPSEEAVNGALKQITGLIKLGHTTVQVPSKYAFELFNRNLLAKQLQDEFDVKLQVRQNLNSTRAVPATPEMPAGEQHAVVYEALPTAATGTAQWTLTGDSNESCAAAKAAIEKKMQELEAYDTVGFLWLARPGQYSSIIGPMGSTINGIRGKCKCTIFVPKNDRKTLNPIEVVGSRADVESTVETLLERAA